MKKWILAACLLPLSGFATPETHTYDVESSWLLDAIEHCAPQYQALRQRGNVWAESRTEGQHVTVWSLKAFTPSHPLSSFPARDAGRLTIVQRYDLTKPVPADGEPFSTWECRADDYNVAGKQTKYDVYVNYLLGALELCPNEYTQLRHSGYAVWPGTYSYEQGKSDGQGHRVGAYESYEIKAVVPGSPVSGMGPYDAGKLTITKHYEGIAPADGPSPYRLECKLEWK